MRTTGIDPGRRLALRFNSRVVRVFCPFVVFPFRGSKIYIMRRVFCALAVLASAMAVSAVSAVQTQQETIAQCARELSLDNPVELRRRAALIVGKYDDPQAAQILSVALSDPDPVVRRNALVSLGEAGPVLHQAGMAVLERLGDGDVTVRRLASSLIPQALGVFISGNVLSAPNIRIVSGLRTRNPEESRRTAGLLNLALGDSDGAVRRNALMGAAYFPGMLAHGRLEPFLSSPECEVRMTALMLYACRSDAGEDRITSMLKAMMPRATADDRRTMLDFASQVPAAAAMWLLAALSHDDDAAIRVQAMAVLFRLAPPEASQLPQLLAAIHEEGVPAALRARLLPHVAGLSKASLRALSRDQSLPGEIRRGAWIEVRNGGGEEIPVAELAEAVCGEADASCRRVIMRILWRRANALTAEQLRHLQECEYDDVRKDALDLCKPAGMDDAARAAAIRDGLLDDSVSVRCRAIQLLGQLRPDGWIDDLLATLDDPDAAIADAAAMQLRSAAARKDPRVAPALQKRRR